MHCQCKKIEDQLNQAGFKKSVDLAYTHNQQGPGDFRLYFDYLFERRLQGEDKIEPSTEELWNLMKAQLNFYQGQLAKAFEDYTKLENRLRDAHNLIKELVKDSK